jgi:TonB family protein
MTLTIKNPPESNSPAKPGATSQNSGSTSGQSPRSNPVCLEVGITIRSLPTEANGLTQPIREEGKTVIVFDNGAVLRTSNNLPIGQSVILSNANGRDVVCRVVGGRNLPSVKGYAEVEFLEPVKDFWGIHQSADTAAGGSAAPPLAPFAFRETPAPPVAASPGAATPSEEPARPASASLGNGPSFEDIPGLLSTPSSSSARDSKTQSVRRGTEQATRDNSDYNLSEIAQPTAVGNWRPPDAEVPTEKRAIAAMSEALSSTSSPSSAPSRDFMSKGLMAYEQPSSSSSESNGRMPMILGAAGLVLVGVCAGVFFMRGRTTPVAVAKADVPSQVTAPELPAAKSAPEPVKTPREEVPQAAVQTQPQAESVAADQSQAATTMAPVPAVATSPVETNARTDARNVRRQEKSPVASKVPDVAASRRPMIQNLKMGSPSAPNQSSTNLSESAAPMTEIASTEAIGGTPSAGLLTSAGRTSNPPAPPSAPVAAPKIVSSPKLVSSTRPLYPTTAKQSNIQGTVTVSANVDETGKVSSARALNGPLLLREAAVEAVKHWKYSPGLTDGKPTPSQVTVGVEFRLN